MHSYISSTENCTVIKRTSLLCSLYKEYFGVVHISIMWIDLQLLRIGRNRVFSLTVFFGIWCCLWRRSGVEEKGGSSSQSDGQNRVIWSFLRFWFTLVSFLCFQFNQRFSSCQNRVSLENVFDCFKSPPLWERGKGQRSVLAGPEYLWIKFN